MPTSIPPTPELYLRELRKDLKAMHMPTNEILPILIIVGIPVSLCIAFRVSPWIHRAIEYF